MRDKDKEFLTLLSVTILGMLIEFLMTFCDQVIVGHRLGETALAAVGLAYPLDLTLDAFCAIFSSGAMVRYLSAKASDNGASTKSVLSTALYMSIFLGLFFGGTVWTFQWNYLSCFNLVGDIIFCGNAYLEFIIYSMMLQPLVALLYEFNWVEERAGVCAAAMITQLAVNIVFSWILTDSMGTGGAALGTALGYLASALINGIAIVASKHRREFGLDFSYVEGGAMIRDAAGDTACPFLSALLTFIMSAITAAYFGNEMLPLTTLLVDLGAFMMVFEGISSAMENTVGKAFAERDFAEIRKCMRLPMISTVVLSAIVCILFLIFSPQILSLMGIVQPELLGEGVVVVRIFAVSIIGFALFRVFDSYYAFIERPVIAFMLTLFAVLIVPLIGILAGAYLGGFRGFTIGYCVAPLVACVLMVLWEAYRYGWKDCPLIIISTQVKTEKEDAEQYREWHFGFSKVPLIVFSALFYLAIMVFLWNYWTSEAKFDTEFNFDTITHQLERMSSAGMSDEVLREYIANGQVDSDSGYMMLMAQDGVTIEYTHPAYQKFIGRNLDDEVTGVKLGDMELGKNYYARLAQTPCFVRKIKVSSHDVLMFIERDDAYWSRNRSFYFAAISLFACFVIFLTVALRGSRTA